jgi:hypothetical protein
MRNQMTSSRILPCALLACCSLAAAAQQDNNSEPSLGDAARAARATHSSASFKVFYPGPSTSDLHASLTSNSPTEYGGAIRQMLFRKDFSGLEEAATAARSSRERFPGGTWKLYEFYDSVSSPPEDFQASNEAWEGIIANLKDWGTANPESVTAKIALAQAYVSYGHEARGNGYAGSVTEDGWRLLAERTDIAYSILQEAAALSAKCPYGYEVMIQIARDQGWPKEKTEQVVEGLYALDPAYYHVYREYANYLLPKWYGTPGEAEAFAESISDRIGGDAGDFVYFELATTIYCGCEIDGIESLRVPLTMSWPRIKKGYAVMERLYGNSLLKMNRYAMLATRAHDKDAAKDAFTDIGEDWDSTVWPNKMTFDAAKRLAMY